MPANGHSESIRLIKFEDIINGALGIEFQSRAKEWEQSQGVDDNTSQSVLIEDDDDIVHVQVHHSDMRVHMEQGSRVTQSLKGKEAMAVAYPSESEESIATPTSSDLNPVEWKKVTIDVEIESGAVNKAKQRKRPLPLPASNPKQAKKLANQLTLTQQAVYAGLVPHESGWHLAPQARRLVTARQGARLPVGWVATSEMYTTGPVPVYKFLVRVTDVDSDKDTSVGPNTPLGDRDRHIVQAASLPDAFMSWTELKVELALGHLDQTPDAEQVIKQAAWLRSVARHPGFARSDDPEQDGMDLTPVLSYEMRRREIIQAEELPIREAGQAKLPEPSHLHIHADVLEDTLAPRTVRVPQEPLPDWSPTIPTIHPLWQGSALRTNEAVGVAIVGSRIHIRLAVRIPGYRTALAGDESVSSEVTVTCAPPNSSGDVAEQGKGTFDQRGIVLGTRLVVRHVDVRHPDKSSACLEVRGAGAAHLKCVDLQIGVVTVDAVRSRGHLFDVVSNFGAGLPAEDCRMLNYGSHGVTELTAGKRVWGTLLESSFEQGYVHADGSVVYVAELQYE